MWFFNVAEIPFESQWIIYPLTPRVKGVMTYKRQHPHFRAQESQEATKLAIPHQVLAIKQLKTSLVPQR